MRISADDRKIKRNALISRAIIIGSLVVIGALFVLSLPGTNFLTRDPETFQIIYIAMIVVMVVVFVLSRIGLVYANRFLSPFRPEKILRDSLKGLDRKYALMLFRKPVDYFLVDPGGVTVFVCKQQRGVVSYRGGKWRKSGGGLSSFFASEEPLGDPFAEATAAMAKVNELLHEKLPALKIPVQAVVVFTHAEAQLDVEPAPITALKPDGLKDFLRGGGKRRELPSSIQRSIRSALDAPELLAADAA